jgi:hypothetical protein
VLELGALGWGKFVENRAGLLVSATIQGADGGVALGREGEVGCALVVS